MKTVAIMQPTFLPWIGYFSLIDQVDTFVFLDSVQFDKRSWQQRNRIKTAQGAQYLSVPVLSKGKRDQKICEVEIDTSQKFQIRHLKTIENNYRKAPYFLKYWQDFKDQFLKEYSFLSDLNIILIKWFCEKLGLNPDFLFASKLNVEGKKVELLIDICRKTNADCYLSPLGSKTYIEDNNLFEKQGIMLQYQDYVHPQYSQLYSGFISHLSVLDLLLNEGNSSLKILRMGQN